MKKIVQLESSGDLLYPDHVQELVHQDSLLSDYLETTLRKELLTNIYPIGSILMLCTTENPNNFLYPLSWKRVSSGKVLVGYGYLDNDPAMQGFFGGDTDIKGEYNVQLTEDTIPAHTHGLHRSAASSGDSGFDWGGSSSTVAGAVLETGGSGPHNNVMPYVAYNIWERVYDKSPIYVKDISWSQSPAPADEVITLTVLLDGEDIEKCEYQYRVIIRYSDGEILDESSEWGTSNSISVVVPVGGSCDVEVSVRDSEGTIVLTSRAPTLMGESEKIYVEYPEAAMTSNSSQGCVVSSSSKNSSAYDPWKAFDKSYSNNYGWASKAYSTDSSPYIQIKLPQAIHITRVSIANRTWTSKINGVIAGSILGSTDGSTWTTIHTITGRDGATSGLLTMHECTDTEVAYQYVRVKPTNWTNRSASSDNYVSIGEIYINGWVEG